jgi:hypothetical protein
MNQFYILNNSLYARSFIFYVKKGFITSFSMKKVKSYTVLHKLILNVSVLQLNHGEKKKIKTQLTKITILILNNIVILSRFLDLVGFQMSSTHFILMHMKFPISMPFPTWSK